MSINKERTLTSLSNQISMLNQDIVEAQQRFNSCKKKLQEVKKEYTAINKEVRPETISRKIKAVV